MTEDEASVASEQIGAVLEGSGFGWISGYVAQTIALGKPATKTIQRSRESEEVLFAVGYDDLASKGRRSEKRLGTEPYSARESLALLIDAIENALVAPNAVAGAALHELKTIGVHASTITFVSEPPEEISTTFTFEDVTDRAADTARLQELLQQVRSAI